MAYLDSKKRNIRIYQTDLQEHQNIFENDEENIVYLSPIWSQNGQKLAFVSITRPFAANEKAIWNVWVYEKNQSKKVFTSIKSIRLLGWNNSEDELICLLTEEVMKSSPIKVNLIHLSISGSIKTTQNYEKIYAQTAALSPNTEKLTFVRREDDNDNIFVASVNDGTAKKITNNSVSANLYGSPAWSADGKKIFFDKQTRVNTISVLENFK